MRATFAGANIKGTPSMRASFVRHDLRVLKRNSDVFVVQEFRWPWYWRVAERVLDVLWNSFPAMARVRDSSKAAQAVFWKTALFKRVGRYKLPAFDFKTFHGGIMDDRWIRAALLRARSDGFTAWFLTDHFVVNGDGEGDDELRRRLLRQNIEQLDLALGHLVKTGHPIMGEIDGNIHEGTWAYGELMKVFRKYGAVIHGDHGIEFAFTINNDKGKFVKVRDSKIGVDKLKTDHEVRLLHWTGHSMPNK